MRVAIGEGGLRLQLDNGRQVPLGDFSTLKGCCKGTVFLVASGPSVAQFPMARYRNWPMLAMNGSILRFIEEDIRPLFYLCDDRGVAQRKSSAVADGIRHAQYSTLGMTSFEQIERSHPDALEVGNLYLLERANRLSGQAVLSDRRFAWRNRRNSEMEVQWSLLHQKRNRIGFSRDIARGYFNARTIAYAALQLAFHLGFTRVVMVGVDMSPEQGQFYDPQGSIVRSRLGDDWGDYILPSFQLLAERVIAPRFQVFNLSQKSRIDAGLVPKLELSQLDAMLSEEAI